ncbi:putative Phosphatidylinositol 3 4 5-trisphosphate 3-phosphatase [Balamuthia mandrillaris]
MLQKAKHKVSKSKRRFIQDGFDLDLSYINENIMAMGFPSEGSESIYRNPMTEVQRLLETKHKDCYRVYNLCSERSYDHKKFHGRVARFPFDDHNCPNFEDIWRFCEDVQDWISQDPKNLAVIHCKAGKGRTGLMICCWLIFNKDWERAEDAMKFYAAARTYNQKGVTIPSQIRYIHYFEKRCKDGEPIIEPVFLSRVVLHGLPKNVLPEIKFTITLFKGLRHTQLFAYKRKLKELLQENKERQKHEDIELQASEYYEDDPPEKLILDCNDTPLCGDVKFEFEKMMHFWINTGFIEGNKVVLSQPEIDKAHKDKKNKVYPRGFKVVLYFKTQQEFLGQQGLVGLSDSDDLLLPLNGTSSLSLKRTVELYPSLKNL